MKVYYSELFWYPFVNPVLVCVQCGVVTAGCVYALQLDLKLLCLTQRALKVWETYLQCLSVQQNSFHLHKMRNKSYVQHWKYYGKRCISLTQWEEVCFMIGTLLEGNCGGTLNYLCCLRAFVGLPAPIEVITDWLQSRCVWPLDIFLSVMWAKLTLSGRAVTIHRAKTKCL